MEIFEVWQSVFAEVGSLFVIGYFLFAILFGAIALSQKQYDESAIYPPSGLVGIIQDYNELAELKNKAAQEYLNKVVRSSQYQHQSDNHATDDIDWIIMRLRELQKSRSDLVTERQEQLSFPVSKKR